MTQQHQAVPQQGLAQHEGVPQQTDNRPRDEDGEQDVGQDVDLAYDALEDAEP